MTNSPTHHRNNKASVSPVLEARIGDIDSAIREWSNVLGDANVVTTEDQLRDCETATFSTNQRIPAILKPDSAAEVQDCVKIANECKTTFYPVSRGYNWGLGSKVPVQSGCVVLDLGRLNRILEYNEELGYLVVEPGVSFTQAVDFLSERKSKHFLSVIGGPPDASVIGNLIERGDGFGPLGDRAEHACGFEVVLGTGEIVRTGFAQIQDSAVAHLHRLGVGPSLDGLFTQSNLGIVTKATVWLNPIPSHYQAFFFCVDNLQQLSELAPRLRELQRQHVIMPSSAFVWNAYKVVAVLGQHPNPSSSEFDVQKLLAKLSPKFAGVEWMGGGGLYAASAKMAKAQRAAIKKELASCCSRLTFIDQRRYDLLCLANRIVTKVGLSPVVDPKILDGLFATPAYLGYPSDRNLRSIYWRKTTPPPDSADPHRDRCGLLWLCHAVPYTKAAIHESLQTADSVIKQLGFEPNLALKLKSERCVHLAIQITWDRDEPGHDEEAEACRRELEQELNRRGFTAYRLGINSMDSLQSGDQQSVQFVERIKQVCDPNGILSPGRYILGSDCGQERG